MKLFKLLLACACGATLLSLACGGVGKLGSAPTSNTAANNTSGAGATPSNSSGTAAPETGVEKVKPSHGTGNVQG
jgi:hypothetical protein